MEELSHRQNKYNTIARKSWNIFRIILLSMFLFIAAIQMNFLWLFGGMPGVEDLENPKSEMASEIYSADNMLLGKYFKENRSPVEFDEISPNIINALVSTEDVRFYKHSGIDLKGFLAIFWYMLKGDQRGSSTITQQLAKNLFKTRSQGSRGLLGYVPGLNVLIIKAKEWMMAIQLEKAYSKEEIINMYLNTVDFGSNAYGIKVASETFFSSHPDSLNIQQAATLIGILKATTTYSPKFHPDRALERRNIVLGLMEENKVLSKVQTDSLKKLPLGLEYRTRAMPLISGDM
jgi:penicillin-binding protein 1A